jgi:hypothetical protein
MKKLFIISAIAISGLIYNTADAQIRVHLGLHLGLPRIYIPAPIVVEHAAPVYNEQAAVYDQPATAYNNNNDDYYYLPDVDAYYNVNDQCYFYFDGNNWISAAYLPGAYRNYDWRNAPRYEVRAPRPYLHDDFYRSHYNGRVVSGWTHANYNNHFDNGNTNRVNNQRFDNREQRDTRGGSEHFAQNNSRGGFTSHRMTKF